MATTLPLTQAEKELKEKVAISCRVMGTHRVAIGNLGHVSARLPGTDRILIKSRGPEVEAMEFATERDVIAMSIDGEVLEAPDGLTRPAETAMHLAVYRRRPDVMSVIHSHPDWVVILTGAGKPLVPMLGAYDGGNSARLILEGCPVYPRSVTISNDELAEDFMNTMGNHRVCLLFGHGMTVAGSSVEDATHTSLLVYETARINYLTYAIGEPQAIPEQDLQRYGTPRPSTGDARLSDWRYERKRLPKLPDDGS